MEVFGFVQDGSWKIESIGMIGMDQSKVEQYLVSLGAKSLGTYLCVAKSLGTYLCVAKSLGTYVSSV